MDELKNFPYEVYVGGPVQQDTLHFIHRSGKIEHGEPILDNIFWGGTFDQVLIMADTHQLKPEEIKFFLGYSGWGPGQLVEELEQDSWIVCDFVSEELLFEVEPPMMWRKALDNMGGRFSVYANYPVDPNLN